MITLTDFYTILENATTVEEEGFDVRFEEIVTLVDQERLDEASTLISDLLNEGTVDIRLVMYQFYAQFTSQGILSIEEVFPAIIRMITDYWEKISPVNLREKYLLSSLTWYLSSIVKTLKRTEKLFKDKKPDEFWNQSIKILTHEDIQRLIAATHELTDYLVRTLQQPSLNQYTMYIIKWLESLKTLIHEEKPIEKTPSSSSTPPSENNTSQKQPISLQEILTSSEPMMHLYRKIQAFESLIEDENFEKAALVSDDIAQIIKSFDPSVFFPKLFSRYFSLSAANMDSLSQEWENKGSLKWEALNRLYQTDLEEFIEW